MIMVDDNMSNLGLEQFTYTQEAIIANKYDEKGTQLIEIPLVIRATGQKGLEHVWLDGFLTGYRFRQQPLASGEGGGEEWVLSRSVVNASHVRGQNDPVDRAVDR